MAYTLEQVEHFNGECHRILHELEQLQLRIVAQGQPLDPESRLREHLLHGAARRVGAIRRAIQNIYALFPPETERPLQRDVLADVNINLHAHVMNLYGLYDNWAWAYVLQHNLEEVIGGRRRVGLFIEATRNRLPTELREYLSLRQTTEWHQNYAKSFRDALAHRIPPYIPPALLTPEEGTRHNELELEKVQCITNRRWERLEEVWTEQGGLGAPCPYFLHAYTEETPPRPVYLHPQVLSDAMAVIEFGDLFLEHWRRSA